MSTRPVPSARVGATGPRVAMGPGRTVWLASYPKSGNTWVRAIITALGTHRALFAVNQLGSGSQPNFVSAALPTWGLDARWLDRSEVDMVRDQLIRRNGGAGADAPVPPIVRKTHETWRSGVPGAEPFPLAATRAAIHVVRDPRDVACSYAPFFGVDLPTAVDAIARDRGHDSTASPARLQTAQPWGSWSSHTASWRSDDVPFPVLTLRYEDLKADAVGALGPILRGVGLECSDEELAAAVEQTQFERLQESERERGFRETSPKTRTFFRTGRAEGWRDELGADLVAAVEADHGQTMSQLGYTLATADGPRVGLAEVRASRRRQESSPWWQLPPELGLTVERGAVPDQLAGAEQPRPWIQVTPTEALLRFASGAGLWVRGGKDVTVHWDPEPGQEFDDPSWLLHGWAVTLAALQRGGLSLHAATVRIGAEVIAIAGHRGAGKSTTSMALRQAGHQLLVDDVTLLELRDDGAWMQPYSRNVHLLPDAAEALGMDFDKLPLLAGGRSKAGFLPEEPPTQPQRIDRIVVLAPGPPDTAVAMSEARGTRRLQALIAHTSRDGIAPIVLGQHRYFDLMSRLADATPVSVLTRPRGTPTIPAVIAALTAGADRKP